MYRFEDAKPAETSRLVDIWSLMQQIGAILATT
jgi:hypothetical protein